MLSDTIKQIAVLQPHYSSTNTDEMKRRGELIRNDLPEQLSKYRDSFSNLLGRFGTDISFEGRDGIGRKTPAPWVRIYSKELSPSATVGYYLVIHFSVDGTRCFVTVGSASSTWDSDRGDLVTDSDEKIAEKVNWCRTVVESSKVDYTSYLDAVEIGSDLNLPKSFEKATAFCQTHYVETLEDAKLIVSIEGALRLLAVIYASYVNLEDLPSSAANKIDLESVVNPVKKNSASRQGFGLSGPERRAVELQAMKITKAFLNKHGYRVKDTSANHSYDFLASKDEEELKVEVKGTTSTSVDGIMMTANEVLLHLDETEDTSLAIVSGIRFEKRGVDAKCSGGELEYRNPSNIDDWKLEPSAYLVKRDK